jgi:DNA-binding NarL/FixJ family response regulator
MFEARWLEVAVATEGTGAILVVDDEPNVAAGFSRDVSRAGWRPLVANSVHEASQYLDDKELTGMIVDVYLPDGSGLELIRDVRARKPNLPILVVTGAHSSDIANEAHLVGVEYACKPSIRANVVAFLARCGPAIDRISKVLAETEALHCLTPAEIRVVGAALENASHARLAAALCLSPHTVKSHVTSILDKTGAATLEEFVIPLRARAFRQ